MINQLKFIIGRILSWLKSSFINFNFRRHNTIGRNCQIKSSTKFGKNIKVADHAIIADDVEIDDNVVIGSQTILRNISIGLNSYIEKGVIVTGYGKGKITIGKECYIGMNNILDHSNDIAIGDFVHIAGPSTGVWTHSSAKMCFNGHQLNDKNEANRPTQPITIENNVYIGGNCTIYPGVTIGHHSVVAPNSAVTSDVEPYSIVGGVPAVFIKNSKSLQL